MSEKFTLEMVFKYIPIPFGEYYSGELSDIAENNGPIKLDCFIAFVRQEKAFLCLYLYLR